MMRIASSVLGVLWLGCTVVDAFVPSSSAIRAGGRSYETTTQLHAKKSQQQTIEAFRERQTRLALVESQLALPLTRGELEEVFVIGQASLPILSQSGIQTDRFRTCVVLSVDESASSLHDSKDKDKAAPAMLLPLSSPAQLKLLTFAKANHRPLSKSVLLGLNPLLVNRDGGLFDNLPWDLWSVDPQQRNYDAAGNPIAKKFHLGKRDAYNRLMGKDWQGRSASIGNMALRLKYLLEETDEERVQEVKETKKMKEKAAAASQSLSLSSMFEPFADEEEESSVSKVTLAQRILEVQIRELEMDLAEWDYQIAISRTGNPDSSPSTISSLQTERQACQDQIENTETQLQALLSEQEEDAFASNSEKASSMVANILQNVAEWTTDFGKNQAPYRGAIGYAPMLDTQADIDGSVLPYTSPYDLLREILDDQLNCEVIGTVLENTSLLKGTLALGGALVLRRKTAKKKVNIAGEQLEINDEDETFGNLGAKGGESMLVECDADEALGMALTCGIPVHLEPGTWDQSNTLVAPIISSSDIKGDKEKPSTSMQGTLPLWKTQDPELSVLVEGQARNESATERTSPLRIPRTTTSLFDSIFEPTPSDAPSGMFPTDNPIQSLDQYDELDDEGKARTLMSLSNFEGKLPRPRVLRKEKASRSSFVNSLDDLLLPLIDESARRQFLMRDAELRGDTERLEELRNEKTKRQVAKEKAEEARARGKEDVAEWWDTEAELYGGLRADVTQDEGAYSRFLDRDEWYERTRKAQAKKIDKSKFGTLLDGVE